MTLTLPRVFTPPLRDLSSPDASWGHDLIWFCDEILGEPLSDYQEWLALHSLEVLTREKALEFASWEDDPAAEYAKIERLYESPDVRGGRPIPNGRLRFTKVVILIARQNGKTDYVKKLIKWAIFRKRMPEVMAAAQTLNKSIDLWEEIRRELEAPESRLARHMSTPNKANGSKAIWTRGRKCRYRPVGIDENAGRGDTIDLLYIDELRTQKDFTGVNSLEATTTVPDNGLIVTTSNAGADHSVVLRDYRQLATRPVEAGDTENTRFGLFEWSADPDCDIDDVEGWKQANPDLGNGRITLATLRAARESTPEATFRTERLCQWVDELGDDVVPVVPLDRWQSLAVDRPVAVGERVLAVEVSPESERVAFVAAGQTGRGAHLVVRPDAGRFVVDEAVEVVRRFVAENRDPAAVLIDKDSPAAAMVPKLMEAGIEPVLLSGGLVASAFREFRQAVSDGTVTHDSAAVWSDVLAVAQVRNEGGKFEALDRYSGDVAPLVAATFALFGLARFLAEFGVSYKQVEQEKRNPKGTFAAWSKRKGGMLVG